MAGGLTTYTMPKIGAGNRKDYECPNLSETDWAYVAGILDGEGCIRDQKQTHSRHVQPTIRVANTYLGLVEWLRKIFGGSIYTDCRTSQPDRNPNWNQVWEWRRCSESAVYAILSGCIPYMIVKRDRALEIMTRIEKRGIQKKEGV